MVPIITIDGPSGSGKGTVAALVAEQLGWHMLDSGALYRLVGYAVDRAGVELDKIKKIIHIVNELDVDFKNGNIYLNGEDVSLAIRTETAGNNASKVGAIPQVRDALLSWQRGYARKPGLVADGRDMGTVVFPQADLKIYLTASAEERARRRYNQLKEKGIDANVAGLTADILERDARDKSRSVAPLKPAVDAVEIDSTTMGIEEVVQLVMKQVEDKLPGITR